MAIFAHLHGSVKITQRLLPFVGVWVLRFFTVQTALQAQLPPPWQSGTCYEVFIRSYDDSDGDGVGDLNGLIARLDYLNDGDPHSRRDLGISCIWLMPIDQSGSYHGYDVTNYYETDRRYGSNDDFRRLVAEAHRRGIKVLVDLVLNHTSSEHPWFQSALYVPGSPYRDWYSWSPVQRAVPGWHTVWHKSPTADEYYYGFFWQGMPDLNLGNPAVQAETRRIARYWLTEMGVDGFRFDAVQHFFESGDTLRNAGATHPWLRDYQAYIRSVAPQAFTVGEVWDSATALKAYYPDQLDSYFNTEFADALIESVRSGSARRLLFALRSAQGNLPAGRWGSFQRNHDQNRTMTEFAGDVAKARLSAALLLTMPGIPFIYYGEEIGMTGAKPDPRVRTPMHWARGPAAGFTRGMPWEPLQPDSFSANVEAQDADSASLLNLYRRLVHLRAAQPALGAGADFVPLETGSDTVLAFLRQVGEARVLVLANLGGRAVGRTVIGAGPGTLPRGEYTAHPLLGAGARASVTLTVARDGSLAGWRPVADLGPREFVVLELRKTR